MVTDILPGAALVERAGAACELRIDLVEFLGASGIDPTRSNIELVVGAVRALLEELQWSVEVEAFVVPNLGGSDQW